MTGDVSMGDRLIIIPGPNSQRTEPYIIQPDSSRETICLLDKGYFLSDPIGSWVENGGVFDTPPIDFTDGDLTIRCGEGPDGRRWYDTSPQGYGEDFETQPTKGGVKCASGEPEINGRTSSTYTPSNPYTFTRLGNVDISYGRDFECNLDLAVDPEDYDPPSSDSDYVYLGAGRTFLPESSFIRGDPEHPEIYREVSKESEYKLKVLAPLESILSTSASVSPTQVYPGDSFTITVNIENEVDFDIDLGDYDVTGDIVGGVPICQFILTPGTVGAGADVDVLLTCTVPPTAAPQTISGIQVSFTTDIQHPCSDDGTLTVPVPPVTVLRPLPSCTNGLDDDGDGKIDCLDDDGSENCCSDPACPYDDNVNSEGANGGICCDDGADNDGDGAVDAADTDCQATPTERCNNAIDDDGDGKVDCDDEDCCIDTRSCPMYRNNEGANNHVCCNNGWDEDRDCTRDSNGDGRWCESGDNNVDMLDLDCRVPWRPCADGIDNDGDGLVDCLDHVGGWEVCCDSPFCPMYQANEGANGRRCCRNGLDEDNDGLTDWDDTDCLFERCNNGLDDDGDGKIDCLDEDCCLFALCPSRTNEAANDKLCCANGLDDDRDGLVDAADPQCFFEPEICDDGIDNDLDGFVDCWDPDCCNDTAACPIYLTDEGANAGTCCANLRDDDSDASVDCLDDSCCMAATECPMYSINEGANGRICCSNLLDEDVDGAIDMADPDCQLFENCSNGIDDDLDGAVDCNDTDCCMDAACPMYAVNEGANNMLCCNNTLDDDMDTLIDVADPDCQAGILCSVYSDWYNAVGAPDNPCITEPYDFLDNGFIDPRTVCVRDDDGDGLFDQQCDKNQAPPIVVPIG